MAVLSKPQLRENLSRVFSDLFVDDADALVVIHDFLLSKRGKKSPQMVIGKVACEEVGGEIAYRGDDSSPTKAAADILRDLNLRNTLPPATAAAEEIDLSAGSKTSISSIKGQSIVGLFGGVSSDLNDFLEESRFSNGDEVDLEHYLHSFVETPSEKQHSNKAYAAEKYVPSDALLVASVNCFSRKKKRHFFRDGLYLSVVFASEMQMSLSTFLRVRGWLATNKKGNISISYRRIGDCLRLLGGAGALNYYRVSSLFDRLYKVIHSREIWPEMPFEKG